MKRELIVMIVLFLGIVLMCSWNSTVFPMLNWPSEIDHGGVMLVTENESMMIDNGNIYIFETGTFIDKNKPRVSNEKIVKFLRKFVEQEEANK